MKNGTRITPPPILAIFPTILTAIDAKNKITESIKIGFKNGSVNIIDTSKLDFYILSLVEFLVLNYNYFIASSAATPV